MTRICLLLGMCALLVPAAAGAAQRTAPASGVVVGHAGGLVLVAGAGRKVTAVRGRAATGARVVVAHGRLVRVVHAARAIALRDDREVRDEAEVELEGTVAAVGAGTVTVAFGTQMVTIPLPAGVAVPASLLGTKVKLELSFAGLAAAPRVDDDEHELENRDDRGGHDGGGNRGPGGGGR